MSIPRHIFYDIEKLVADKRYDDAWNLLEPYIKEHPNDFDVLHNQAVIYLHQAKITESLDCFRKAMDIDGLNEDHLYNYAAALYADKREDESLALLRRIIALNPNKSQALYTAGDVCYCAKRYREAADYYERFIRIFPHRKKSLLPQIIHCLQWAEHQEPDNVEIKLNLYERLREAGNESLSSASA